MSGAMAAGHMPGMPKVSAEAPLHGGNLEGFHSGLSDASLKDKEFSENNQETPFPKNASCCSIDCGCMSLFIMEMPSMPTLKSSIEPPFGFTLLNDPHSFALPDPPRTI